MPRKGKGKPPKLDVYTVLYPSWIIVIRGHSYFQFDTQEVVDMSHFPSLDPRKGSTTKVRLSLAAKVDSGVSEFV
jgi:hypothetical protein